MNISINEPCHENWDTMTPNQQGAFCGSCQKNVVDFSKMSLEKIKEFFSKPSDGKVCGRFEEKQLTELSFDAFFARFRYWNFAKKFAIIFFLAFGFWVFSAAKAQAQERHLKGEVMYVPEKPKSVKKDTVKKQIAKPVTQKHLMGKIKCVKPVVKEPEPMIMGAVAYIEPVKDIEPVKLIEPLKDDSLESTLINPVIPEDNIMDQIDHCEYPVVKIEPAVEETQKVIEPKEDILVFPNPGNGIFTLETKTEGKQTLYILDESGKLVLTKTILGTSTIDASSLRAGIYNLSITGNNGETITNRRLVIVR